jgi:hypothetical protein
MFEAYSFTTSPANAGYRNKVMPIESKVFQTSEQIAEISVIGIQFCCGIDERLACEYRTLSVRAMLRAVLQ